MTQVENEELLREKSLRDVYHSARAIPVSKFNQCVSVAVFAILLLYTFNTPEPAAALAEKVRNIADYGFSFATSILSFLIAGFTIYLAMTKSDLLVFLAETRNEKTSLPEIKHVAFLFMRVMAYFVFFCLACVSIKLLGSPNGPVSLLFSVLMTESANAKLWTVRILFAVLGAGLVHMLMLLQSFIFNIYHSAMVAVVWERTRK